MTEITQAIMWIVFESVKIIMFTRFIFGYRIRKGWGKYFIILFPFLFVLPGFYYGWNALILVKSLWKLIIIYVLFSGRIISKTVVFMIEDVIITIMDITASCINSIILYNSIDYHSSEYGIQESYSIILILLTSLLLKNKRDMINQKIEGVKNYYYYFIFAATVFGVMNFTALEMMMYYDEQRLRIVALCLGLFSTIAILALAFVIIEVKGREERALADKSIVLEKMKDEERYYKGLLQKDASLRRLKHDINGHLISIEALAIDKNTDAIQTYIHNLSKDFMLNASVDTGNSIGNAFIGDIFDFYSDRKDVSVSLVGRFPDTLDVDEVLLCTVLSNALSNAKEAIEG